MKLSPSHIARLEAFLTRIQNETYPEPPTALHTKGTIHMLEQVLKLNVLEPGAKILDVGCGQGPALELFIQHGFSPIGITINPVDLEACRSKGFDVREMDQSFLDFEDQTFDLIWCRHCLEHSIFPFYTLNELNRVLKPGGGLYVELPAPDTDAKHQSNKNHYSVLGAAAWHDLIGRHNFPQIYSSHLDIQLRPAGTDRYLCFFAIKPAAPQS